MNLKKLLNFLLIALPLLMVIIIAFSNSEITNAWDTLFTLRLKWVLAALAGWFAYLFFDAVSFHSFLNRQNFPIPLRFSLYISLIGFYYSNITPGASGGQPMQIYYLNKRKIPVGIASSGISLKFFCSQFMMVFIAAVLWFFNRDFCAAQLGGAKWIILIGGAINFAAVPGILLVALHRPLVQSIVQFLIRAGGKLRLVKNPEQATLHVSAVLDTYHTSILRLGRHPGQILLQLLVSGLSVLGLLSVPVSVYHAFGLGGTPWYQLLTVSFLLFLSVSYTPLPGASGAQEGGFLVFYRGLIPPGTIGLALLVWRFFTYYLFLLVGAGLTLIASLRATPAEAGASDDARPSLPRQGESPGDGPMPAPPPAPEATE